MLIADEEVEAAVATPAVNELFDVSKDAELLSSGMSKRFYSTVQRLLYLCVQFRRDLCAALSF